jgi:two-component system OmpR family response regulator
MAQDQTTGMATSATFRHDSPDYAAIPWSEPVKPDHVLQAGAGRLLCVGAYAYLTDLLRYALTREGYAVQVATSGSEALAVAETWRPHAAIVDDALPDLRGDELGAQLRERHGSEVLLLEVSDRAEAHASGRTPDRSRQLTKPFSLRELVWTLTAMAQAAEQRR